MVLLLAAEEGAEEVKTVEDDWDDISGAPSPAPPSGPSPQHNYRRLEAMISDLQSEFKNLRAENSALRAQLETRIEEEVEKKVTTIRDLGGQISKLEGKILQMEKSHDNSYHIYRNRMLRSGNAFPFMPEPHKKAPFNG
jgi:chromosome segregation ATPase